MNYYMSPSDGYVDSDGRTHVSADFGTTEFKGTPAQMYQRQLNKLTQAIENLSKAGIDIPENLRNAKANAKRKVQLGESALEPALKKLSEIKPGIDGNHEYQAAMKELAHEIAAVEAAKTDTFTWWETHVHVTVLHRELAKYVPGWWREVIDGYNSVAPSFAEAARNLPDYLGDLNPLDVTPDQAEAMRTAKHYAAQLDTYFAAYRALHQLSHGESLSFREYEDALSLAFRLSPDLPNYAVAGNLAKDFQAIASGGGKQFRSLGVHIVPIKWGYSLELTDMDGERERRQ